MMNLWTFALVCMANATNQNVSARLASLDRLIEHTIPVFLDPIPHRETLRRMLDAARIPRFKTSPTAKRGGGAVYYSVSHVEKFLRSRTIPGRITSQIQEAA